MSKQTIKPEEYDGFFFTPYFDKETEQSGVNFSFFTHDDDEKRGEKVLKDHPHGDMWHIILFRESKNFENLVDFDEHFEAILGDPETYATNLSKVNIFGCIIKKTTTSDSWVDDYLKKALSVITTNKLKAHAESLV